MVTTTFQPAAQAVWDTLDPALKKAIAGVDDAMEQVRNNHGAAMVEVWADESQDPGIMYIQPGGQTLRGKKGMEMFRAVDAIPAPLTTLTVEYERIVATKDIAFTVSIESGLMYPPGGNPWDLRGNVTYIYKRFGDVWKLIHRHVHGMDKNSLHTYDIKKCPECGVEMLETPMKIHRMGAHGHKWDDIVAN